MNSSLDDGRAELPGTRSRLTRASKGYRDKERPDRFPRHFRIGAPISAIDIPGRLVEVMPTQKPKCSKNKSTRNAMKFVGSDTCALESTLVVDPPTSAMRTMTG
jgi:hypothetical protein